MLQVAKAIVAGRTAGDRTVVRLIFANVAAEDILLKEELDALASTDPDFHVDYVLNSPPVGWPGEVGFVTAAMIKV